MGHNLMQAFPGSSNNCVMSNKEARLLLGTVKDTPEKHESIGTQGHPCTRDPVNVKGTRSFYKVWYYWTSHRCRKDSPLLSTHECRKEEQEHAAERGAADRPVQSPTLQRCARYGVCESSLETPRSKEVVWYNSRLLTVWKLSRNYLREEEVSDVRLDGVQTKSSLHSLPWQTGLQRHYLFGP